MYKPDPKKSLYAILGISAISVIASGLLFAATLPDSKAPESASPSVSTPNIHMAEGAGTTASDVYIIGEWEGKLAVYKPPASTPEHVYDVMIISLPEEVQSMLLEGITVHGEAELAGYLEDFTS